jgi:hypothetical protein
MNESSVYSEADLAPFHRRLRDLRNIVQDDKSSGKHPEAMAQLLERELNQCDALLQTLLDSLQELSPELVPMHERLVVLRRQLVALAARGNAKAELKPIQDELRKIDSLSVSRSRAVRRAPYSRSARPLLPLPAAPPPAESV